MSDVRAGTLFRSGSGGGGGSSTTGTGYVKVRVATTTSGTLATAFQNGATVDGISLATNDYILIKNQSSQTENGVYVVQASGAPARAPEADSWTEIVSLIAVVSVGSTNADTIWLCTSDAGGTIGSTNITFVATNVFDSLAPTTTLGDLIVRSSTTNTRLPLGTRGKYLAVAGTTAGWKRLPLINYILNPDAEEDTVGWATYADAAGTSPVDGTGGSPTVTWTRSTSSPLRETASFLLTKDAANRQGEGGSYDFTIDSADKAKVIQIQFEYLVASGTFADNDVTTWVYDVTNAVVIQPAPFQLKNTSIAQGMGLEFQSASNSTSYRLIFHVASTSASAYSLGFDRIGIGPTAKLYGSPITDFQSYTPTFTGFGTVSTQDFYWRRVGDCIEIQGRFTTGTVTGTEARISLPAGITSTSNYVTLELSGVLAGAGGHSTTFFGTYVLIEPSQTYMTFGNQTSTVDALAKANGNSVAASTTVYSLTASIKVTGWGSQVVMSNDADTRTVDLLVTATQPTGTIGANFAGSGTTVWGTVVKDSHGGYSAGSYTIQVPGDYLACGQVAIGATEASNDSHFIYYAINGVSGQRGLTRVTATALTDVTVPFSFLIPGLKVGDLVTFRTCSSSTSPVFDSIADAHWMSLARVGGAPQIAASEKVSARYKTSAGQTVTTGSTDIINFDTKDYDSHGAVTTGASWKFTAQRSDILKVTVCVQSQAITPTSANTSYTLTVFKNGSSFARLGSDTSSNTTSRTFCVGNGTEVAVVASDTIDVRLTNSLGASAVLNTTATNVWITISSQ